MSISQFDPLDKIDASTFREIPSDLFGELFHFEQSAFDSLVRLVAAHLEGFAVELGEGPGQVNADLIEAGLSHPALVRVSRKMALAQNAADASGIYRETISQASKRRADVDVKRSVNEARALIKSWVKKQGPQKARCELPRHYGNIGEILATKIEPHLPLAGIFKRDGKLVRILAADDDLISGVSMCGSMIDPHDLDSVIPAISDVIEFTQDKVLGRSESAPCPCPPPSSLMRQLLRLGSWPSVQPLSGVTTGPFLRPDGSACIARGYDPFTGWFLDYAGEPIELAARPSKPEAENACRILLDLIEQFEWGSERQKAGWLAYLLTLVARPAIRGYVPAFVFSASTPGAGKSLLVDIANIIAYGHKPSGYKAPAGNESGSEWKKMLFSFALTGNPSLVVSNFPSGQPVGNAEIDGQITEHAVLERVLGKSETRQAAWIATMAFTGNNLATTADFSFRSIWSCLEPTVENPRSREGFEIPDLKAHVLELRPTLLRECFSILQWGYAQGRHKPSPEFPNFGSFEQWQEIVRYPIIHLTGHDVVGNSSDSVVADQESNELQSLLSGLTEYVAWRKATGENESFTIPELYRHLTSENGPICSELKEVIDVGVTARSFSQTVSNLLNRHKGRVIHGQKLAVSKRDKISFWRLNGEITA